MAKLQLPLLLSLIFLSTLVAGQQNILAQTCSRDNTATIQPGSTAWLGGIISLSTAGSGGYGCGGPAGSMQSYEAVRWLLGILNKKNVFIRTEFVTDYYVPGITLGMMVKNYCTEEKSAVAAMTSVYPELMGDSDSCLEQNNNLTLGIIGPSSSGAAVDLSKAAEDYHIPVVSYEATASQLTMSGMYPNFMRTISPDGPLMEVIIEVLIRLKWSYISIVYDSGTYGRTAYNELHAQLVASDICLTAGIMVDAADLASTQDTLNKVLATGATGVIYFGPHGYAKELVKKGNDSLPASGKLQWIFIDFPLDTNFDSTVYQHGIFSITVASRYIVEFEDHWIRLKEDSPSAENPWYTMWYEDKYNCKFNPTNNEANCANRYAGMSATEKELTKRREYQQDQYVEAAVMAVYTYARALRNAQMAKCPGVSGACPALRAMTREEFMNDFMMKVDFDFTTVERVASLASKNILPYNAVKHLKFNANGDIDDPSYYIWNYNDIETGSGPSIFRFRRIGTYINGNLNMNLDNIGMYSENRMMRLLPLPSSPCPATGCSPCLGLPADVKYYYAKGDVVVNGIFSLHNMGATPLTCGGAKSHNQFQYLEAMIYALKQVNADSSMLNNIKLGGLGMDDCSSSSLGQAFLVQVQRGNLKVIDRSGSELDPLTIQAYTAAHTSPLTLPLAEAMNMLMRPMVGYRAVSSELDDKSMYPYYIRSLPGIYDEIKVIILMLKQLKWMYVQVVTSDMHYSQDAEKVFRDLGAKAGICIVATHNIGETDQEADAVIMGLEANKNVKPTVVLLEMHDSRRLLMAMNRTDPTNSENLALIGTTRWGDNPMVVDGLTEVAAGAMTLSLRHSTLENFRNHLMGLDVNSYTLNPWFREWYMDVHDCSMGTSGQSVECDLTKPITDGRNFMLMYEVENVINAVKAIGQGLHRTLINYCGNSYNTICSAFLNSPDKGTRFLEEIKKVQFTIEDMLPPYTFRFTGNSGAIPFVIHNFRDSSDGYLEVGTSEPWAENLELQQSSIILSNQRSASRVIPTCQQPCLECLYMFSHINYWYIPGDVVIGSIFDIHQKGLGPFTCGALRAENGALYTEVFNFALQRINSGSASVKLNNVTLGGLAFDGCTNPPRATAIVSRVHTGMDIMDASGNKFETSQLISWMSYDSQTTIEAASLLQKLNMPIVSPGATSSVLDNKQDFYTFFRTIPSDSLIVKGMANFVNEMSWQYVVVLNSPDSANRRSRDEFRELLKGFGICVLATYEFETDGSMDVILDSIEETGTHVVAVFAEPGKNIKSFLDGMLKRSTSNLRFIANRPWGKDKAEDYRNQVANSVFFDLNTPTIDEFRDYLLGRQVSNSDNPWLREVLEEILNCNLPGTFRYPADCSTTQVLGIVQNPLTWQQDIWTLSTLNAVYALAEGVHRTLQAKCGTSYTGLCPSFIYDNDVRDLLMKEMDAQSFLDIERDLFEFMEREANRNYKLIRYTPFSASLTDEEGSLDRNGDLTFDDKTALIGQYTGVRSQCDMFCMVCSETDTNLRDITLIPGDIYIVGLFDVHKAGDTPFTCGEINDKHGLPLLEAFNYAIDYVNNKNGIFRNRLNSVQIGGVALDMCQQPSRAANLVSNIHSGNLNLVKDGTTVDPRRIDAYVATMDTKSSIRVADILSKLSIPQISYGATGMDLLDMEKYNFFLRSVPADDKQARAIVSYLKKFSYNNIQVVSSFDEIGTPGLKEFKRLALVNKICVKKEYVIGERGDLTGDSARAVANIMMENKAQVVILWMKDPLHILKEANKNGNVYRNVLFIATDKWGADPDYLRNEDIRNLLVNSKLVILDVETADIHGFDQYLEAKTPDNYQSNPWFKDYFEMHQNCYWDTASGRYTMPCDRSATIPRNDTYVQDPYVLYVMNAVFSAALGIDGALSLPKFCEGIPGVCDKYRNSGERRQNVMSELRKVQFVDSTTQPFFYTEDGQSDRGFHIYNVTNPQRQTTFEYENVGSYNDTHFLKLDITYSSSVDASCDTDQTEACVCEFPPDLPSRFMKKDDGDKGLTLVYVGDIHQSDPNSKMGCGPINTGADLHKLLAFFFAIERVNNNTDGSFPPSIRFDGLALDSCSHSLRLGQDVYNVLSGNPLCDSDHNGQLASPNSIVAFVIDKDHNSLPVSNMLTQKKITSISPTARHSVLSDRIRYPYFLRTRGDNRQTAEVILEVANNNRANWDYLSLIYTDTISHQDARDMLLDRSRSKSVCVGKSVPLQLNAGLDDAKRVLQDISEQVGARAIVLFVEPAHMRLLMQASRSLGLTGRFIWIVPSDWWDDGNVVSGYEDEAAGSIVIETRSEILEKFNEYVTNLTFTNRRGIPDDWFNEIYETIHQCNILNLENPTKRGFYGICTGDEVITDSMVSQDPAVLHVIISVYAIARGIQEVKGCKEDSDFDLAACLQQLQNRSSLIHQAISETNYEVPPDLIGNTTFSFSFDENGNGRVGFMINNYQATSEADSNPYKMEPVGSYVDGVVGLELAKYGGRNLYSRGRVPESKCGDETCTCQLPRGRTWAYSPSVVLNPSDVKVGGIYRHPDTAQIVQVSSVPGVNDRFEDAWAIILTVLACIGVCVSLAVFVYLLIMYPVRGGTSILGFILAFGIILLYLMVFPFIAHADDRICGLRRFCLGFVYAIVYSALAVKLVDCCRVKGKNDDAKYSKLGKPVGLFIVVVFLVLVQVIINTEWLILEEPDMMRKFEGTKYWPHCTPIDFYDEGLVLSLCYIMAIILFSLCMGIYAFSSKKNHKESRWILGIIILTIPCWVIWCLVATLGEVKVRDAAVAVGLLVNATIMLLLVPIRKLYLLHKYNVLIEEEDEAKSQYAASHAGLGSEYGRQYDNNPRLHDTGSNHGSAEYSRVNDTAVAY